MDATTGERFEIFDMTVEEMRAAVPRCPTVILPVGVIEQHGYHLPLSVDVHNAVELARLAARRARCLVAPPVLYNFSGGELPGTLDISPQLVSLLLMEITLSLVKTGFRNVIILLGHGGSEAVRAAKEGAEMFYRRYPGMDRVTLAVCPFYELSPTMMQCFAQKDFHAGLAETSLMLYWHPEDVRPREKWVTDPAALVRQLQDNPDAYQERRKPLDHPHVVEAIHQRPDIQVGVIGWHEGASAELGERIANECVAGLVEMIEKLNGQAGD